MRLHRNLVFAVVDGLNLIFNEGVYASKAVEQILKRDKRWGSRDRSFIAETLYDIVRWKRLYAEIAEVREPFDRANFFRLFAVWAVLRGIPLPSWKQLEETPARRIKGRFDELSKIRKYRESIPDWLDTLGLEAFGEAFWEKEIHALNEPAPVVLRTNTLKTSLPFLRRHLVDEGIASDPVPGYPNALVLKERSNVFTSEAFKEGLFEVQDASSQLVAPMLDVAPGMRVIDACAGAGGKSLHLAALMENKGQLIGLDIYPQKLHELKRRARRNGVHNLETRLIESTKTIKKLHGTADRVLIDAPCTGLGVLRRNPDAKWKLRQEDLGTITDTQRQLLSDYSKMVKPGGKMVYATCSILPAENSEQVVHFLKSAEGADFDLEKEKHIFAHTSGFDGFYIALLQKKG
ncbi:16S rRNA (cytosine967-C5)-methyltransferase [Muriicola jejuensis]|uniref:Methyltransferase domain-containing protein n=1 Tax=Muriicola jejuensis TaxID=504488 RepID=A0A6P0UCE4_9FLAO|nr:methyltransferase domain-containing protein [Muriicola jejuensis]NER10951.1 methyltransferase domain-containing protein [Muriicola jejuensis]SMP15129.1 16S rRNA (cytosine967-C5)-methyltransferase [Muriicola jejuensis]